MAPTVPTTNEATVGDPQAPPPPIPAARNRSGRWRTSALVGGVLLAGLAGFVGCVALARTQMGAYYLSSESMEPTLHKNDRVLADKTAFRNGKLPQRGDMVIFEAPLEATDGNKGVTFIMRVIALPDDTVEVRPPHLSLDGKALLPEEAGFMDLHSYLRDRLGISEDSAIRIFPDHILIDGERRVDLKQLATSLEKPHSKVALTPGCVVVNGQPVEEPYVREDPDYEYPDTEGSPLKLKPGEVFVLGDNRNRARDSHIWGPLKTDHLTARVDSDQVYRANP